MASNPLIPTPRTDKNGRTTIRHMKNPVSQAGAKGTAIPKVSTLPEGFERQMHLKVITGTFVEYGTLTGGNHWHECLSLFSDEQVSKLKDICDEFEGRLHVRGIRISGDVVHVQSCVTSEGASSIDFFHRYRNEVNREYSYVQMDDTRRALKRLDMGGTETIDAHIKATMAFAPLNNPAAPYSTPQKYAFDKKLMTFVERYPERVDDIMRFREERNSSRYSDLEKYFKEVDKLKTPAIMSGWL